MNPAQGPRRRLGVSVLRVRKHHGQSMRLAGTIPLDDVHDPRQYSSSRRAGHPPVREPSKFYPYPATYWDGLASSWDDVVSKPKNPHQFYYFEADLCISGVLNNSMRVLELGCGTGGSTLVHARQVARLVATDFSYEMVRRAARKLSRGGTRLDVQFVVCDASHLPFRDGSFDTVISRGVLLSYVTDPPEVLAEARRILRPGGRIALDAMNRIRGQKATVTRYFCMMGDAPAYQETFVRAGRQVRRTFLLSRTSRYAALARKQTTLAARPRDLRRDVESIAQHEARLFRPREIAELVERTGFRNVQITPLGHLAYATAPRNKRLKDFIARNRSELSRLTVVLADHLRPETALHLFVTASRG